MKSDFFDCTADNRRTVVLGRNPYGLGRRPCAYRDCDSRVSGRNTELQRRISDKKSGQVNALVGSKVYATGDHVDAAQPSRFFDFGCTDYSSKYRSVWYLACLMRDVAAVDSLKDLC